MNIIKLMNKTTYINTKAKRKIEKITAHDIFWMDYLISQSLWKIRSMSEAISETELNRSFALMDENRNDLNEFLEKHNYF